MRARITITSRVGVYMGLRTVTEFRIGCRCGTDLAALVNQTIQAGDCNQDTMLVLDGRDIGTLWQLHLDIPPQEAAR